MAVRHRRSLSLTGSSAVKVGFWLREQALNCNLLNFCNGSKRDRYICPAGKELVQFRRTYATPRSGITSAGTRLYRASKKDCDACELKQRCCPNAVARKVPRDLNEDTCDVARAIAGTPDYERSRHRRKKVEMLFAHLKRILRWEASAMLGFKRNVNMLVDYDPA
ncbi:hypothetical protein ATY31_20275 [Sinorhizobium americanum]|uniref:Transposase DDE domain-containing protein n=1 Tax=Sinorhizobium americanum TaxID=194963 RepID=A0A2S3YJA5_9HYPH|nr:hypothetical protein ATY31_20275 [Sinorhizobium americanum]